MLIEVKRGLITVVALGTLWGAAVAPDATMAADKPQGMAQNECPAWPSTEGVIGGCLQAMWDEGPGKRFSKHGHYANMSSQEYDQVACGFARTKAGKLWSVQNFR
jgi:hypothetical protein